MKNAIPSRVPNPALLTAQSTGMVAPANPYILYAVIAGSVVLVTGLGIATAIGIKRYNDRKNSMKTVDASDTELKNLVKAGDKPTRSEAEYRATGNTIEKLLDGCEGSESEMQVVKEVIKVVKKPVDWYFLVKTFGAKSISDCGTFGMGKTSYDLPTLLKDQLDTNQVVYSITVGNYKDSGYNTDPIDILAKYLSKIGVSL